MSYDVVNLYPSIPIKESITIVINQLQEDESLLNRTKLDLNKFKKLLHLCLSHRFFLYNNNIHTLENSGPIGLTLMVIMAESFNQTPMMILG